MTDKTVRLTGEEAVGLIGRAAMSVDGPERSAIDDFQGRSESYVLPDGRGHRFRISDRPLQAEDNEPNVLRVLAKVLSGESMRWRRATAKQNQNGIDGFVEVGGRDVPVQIVSVPIDERLRARVGVGECEVDVSFEDAARWMVNAIRRKAEPGRKFISRSARSGLILALDARHWGQLANERVLAEFRRQMPGLGGEGFEAVWLVGSTAAGSRVLA